MTYATLQTDVAEYMHRTDLASKIPTFISIAESMLFRELQIKDMAVSVVGTTTGEYATLPADFGSVSRLTVTYGGNEYPLDYKSTYSSTTTTPAPNSYALENNQLRIFVAATGLVYTLYYIPKIQALSDTNTTNWLLDNAKDLYIYASALEGSKHIRDEAEIAKLTSMVGPLLDSVRRLSERKGQPANGSLQIKPRR